MKTRFLIIILTAFFGMGFFAGCEKEEISITPQTEEVPEIQKPTLKPLEQKKTVSDNEDDAQPESDEPNQPPILPKKERHQKETLGFLS